MKIKEESKIDIINAYVTGLEPMAKIARQYGVTRATIYNIMKQAGVDTTKQLIPVSCTVCGTVVHRHKSHVRKTKYPYCSVDCYYAAIENKRSKYWRHGQRIARTLVSEHFDLQPEHVVHHIDGNNYNNSLDNLCVFANQGDHVRYHRGFDVPVLWQGV